MLVLLHADNLCKSTLYFYLFATVNGPNEILMCVKRLIDLISYLDPNSVNFG